MPAFFFLFFVFLACRKLCRGSVILTPHTLNTYLGGCYYQSQCLGYNPFEMQLSVITHRHSWSWALLWGVTLHRCLAQPLKLPGLQRGLHTGILVLPLVRVPTNYPFKDCTESCAPLLSLPRSSIFLFMSLSLTLSFSVLITVSQSLLFGPFSRATVWTCISNLQMVVMVYYDGVLSDELMKNGCSPLLLL